MPKKITLLVLFLYAYAAQAQVRAGFSLGPAFSLKKANTGLAPSAKKYMNAQFRIGVHKGRIALVLTSTLINQVPKADTKKEKVLDTQLHQNEFIVDQRTIRNTSFSLGPEVCFPIGPMKLHLYCSGGVGFIKAPVTEIKERGLSPAIGYAVYQSKLKSTSGIFKAGINLNYSFTKNISFSMYADYLYYSLEYINIYKRGQNNIFPWPKQSTFTQYKSLVGIYTGITYKF